MKEHKSGNITTGQHFLRVASWNKTTKYDCQSSKSLNGPNKFKLSLQFVSTTKVKTLSWTGRTGSGGPTRCLTPGVQSSWSCRTAEGTFVLSNQKSTKPAWDQLTWHVSATSCNSFEEDCRKLAVKTCQSKKYSFDLSIRNIKIQMIEEDGEMCIRLFKDLEGKLRGKMWLSNWIFRPKNRAALDFLQHIEPY